VILEVAMLNVKKGQEKEFEDAFKKASMLMASMKGYVSHELQRCIETPNQYILLASWQTLENHTVGFRTSKEYLSWKEQLHHFYEPFPKVEHFQKVYSNNESIIT
jgi:heme-degrading monooxygenase HmoA